MDVRLTRHNPYTFHHIKEERKGGLYIIDNGAILTKKAHTLLNYLEINEPKRYDEFQKLFKYLNKTEEPPKEEYFMEIDNVYSKVKTRLRFERSGMHYYD